jgi:hypothetical protein
MVHHHKFWLLADHGTFQFRIGEREELVTDSAGHSALSEVDFDHAGAYPPASTLHYSPWRIYSRGGVWTTTSRAVGNSKVIITAKTQVRAWVVACWLPSLILTALFIWRMLMLRRMLARLRKVGFCRNCGYDLRATPDRCPECGHESPFKPSRAHAHSRTDSSPQDAAAKSG